MTTLQRRWARVKATLAPPPAPPPLPPIDAIELWRLAMNTEPDPWQAEVLRSSAPRICLNAARQSGKSSVVALRALHGALSTKSLTLLLSRSLRQSAELARKVFDAYQSTGRRVPSEAESTLCLELTNGSRIIALPGGDEGSIRGYSGVSALIIDESSRCDDALYTALRPMVAVSRGTITLLSTPFGKRGFFHQVWTQGQGWLKICIKADACPRLTKEFLAEELRELGRLWYRQEYLCEFVETTLNPFHEADILAAVRSDILPMFPGRRFGHDELYPEVLARC